MALITVHHASDAIRMNMDCTVLLPENGRASRVLYLLHGKEGNHQSWTRYTQLETKSWGKDVAIVMPDAHLSWYTDMALGYDYYTYIAKELPELVKRWFPNVDGSKKSIGGLSMGGYGALKIALSNPRDFDAVVALSPAVDILSRYPRDPQGFADIFGDKAAFAGSKHDLFFLSEQAKDAGLRIYLACGRSDVMVKESRALYQHQKQLGMKVKLAESEGKHDFAYWDGMIDRMFAWLAIKEVRHGVV